MLTATESYAMTTSTLQPSFLPQKPEQAWWNRCSNFGQMFFSGVHITDLNIPSEHLLTLLVEIEQAYKAVHIVDYPTHTRDARFCLLTAMEDMISALAACLAGDHRMGLAYLQSAHIELDFMYDSLTMLGVQFESGPGIAH